jgi:DNA-binding CsgD family transcriptional regulator
VGRIVIRACAAVVGYIALFAVLDAQLETHAETSHQMLVRLTIVVIALIGALGVLMHVILRARAAQEESERRLQAAQEETDRRLQALQEEARLEGALLTIRELAPWVAPNTSHTATATRVRTSGAPPVVGMLPSQPSNSRLLTSREREVAMLIAQGRTSREIAEALVITERTADTHADRIRAKLGLHSRAEIVAWVLSRGLSAGKP